MNPKALFRRFWPRSLARQMALLVAAALLIAQGVNFGIQLSASQRQRQVQTASFAVARLAEAVARAESAQPGIAAIVSEKNPIIAGMVRRDDVIARARQALGDLGLPVQGIDAAEAMGREFRYLRNPASGLLERVEGPKRMALLVTAQIGERRWVSAVAQFPPYDWRVALWLLFQTVLLYGFVVIPVVWFVWRLSRPLRELRFAVDAFTSAAPAPPVRERGPDDIRRLVGAFNAMRARLGAMLDEKDRMLGAIGHDLRTPLASLRVRTELVEDEGERDRMAATIDEMNRTLDDILSLARLGRPSEAPMKVDLPGLVDSVVDEFVDLGAPVEAEEGDRLAVTMRPTLVKRVIRNLIENALKYGVGGPVRIRVRPDRGGAAVEIDDDGPGIPDADIEAMFEPFARGEQSRSRETGGAGLGLALARAIATEHRGTLKLANRAEGGLRATLWLPAE